MLLSKLQRCQIVIVKLQAVSFQTFFLILGSQAIPVVRALAGVGTSDRYELGM